MTRKLSAIFISSLLIFALLAGTAFSMKDSDKAKNINMVPVNQAPMVNEAGVEEYVPSTGTVNQSLGFDQSASLSPGKVIGSSTYDYQHNGRMNRQVDWRGTQRVHFTWMKQLSYILGQKRRAAYQAWNPTLGDFDLTGLSDSGGCDIHSILASEISGYVGLDVTPGGKVVLTNHHSPTGVDVDYAATVWYDYDEGTCYFNNLTFRLPDTTMHYFPAISGANYMIWPNIEYQVNGTDTVTHLVAQQGNTAGGSSSIMAYFRRVGSATSGVWDYPPVTIDTVNDIAYLVAASRTSRKVAVVWLAPYPYGAPGGSESGTRGGNQRVNDVYYRMSTNMGAAGTWVPATGGTNVTKFDSSQSGWLAHSDISALIGTDDYLHIIWNAREYSPAAGGTWVHFFGSRLFHWDENSNLVRVIKDANWDLPDQDYCYGGAWNEMSIVKMQISECDGKFYALFAQFNDIFHGVTDDCHYTAFTAGNTSGTANGELYISVSDNGGLNWDIARNLTNSYTPRCDTVGNTGSHVECDADQWPSMSRFGMDTLGTGADFSTVPVVDPSGSYTGSKYLDVFYTNDKYPGGAVQDAGIWTTNPMKWFRVPCVNPVPNPVLSWSPSEIADPAWTKPNVQLDTLLRLENIGNAVMNLSSVTPVKLTGTGLNWLNIGSAPTQISHLTPNYATMHLYLGGAGVTGPTAYRGLIVFAGDFAGSPDTMHISIIVADTVQFVKWAKIRTTSKAIWFNNAGNLGRGGDLYDGWNAMAFFNDCDTAGNTSGQNDNSRVYLYDASPFVLKATGATDTTFFNYIWDEDWLSESGFRPLVDPVVDSITHADYQYAYTGKYLTRDSAIAMESEYFVPKTSDSSDFIIQKVKFYATTATIADSAFLGEVMDWDIPSDSGVENGSGIDGARKMMYVFGGEYGADTGQNSTWNDCVLANARYGGFSYYGGYKKIGSGMKDSIGSPKGMFTGTNANWQRLTGNFPPQTLYNKLNSLSSYQAWQALVPAMEDSLYQDLNMVACYGKFKLNVGDTMVFIKIFSTVYNSGLTGLQASIDKAKQWIANRPSYFGYPPMITTCCDKPGDANNNGAVQITDVSFIINFLYKHGPTPPCRSEADANGNNAIQITDVSYIINFLYKHGPAPICGHID